MTNHQLDQHSSDCFSVDMRSTSNGGMGGCGSGPSSVPSSIGLQNLFGRSGTMDSDSGASNNDAESPLYSKILFFNFLSIYFYVISPIYVRFPICFFYF